MSTFNQSSSYNRTFERKVVEETVPRLLSSSPLHTIKSTMSGFGSPGDLGLGSTSFVQPHNYQFGTATSGSFQSSDDYLSVSMDVSAFAPEDLKVSIVGNQLVVEGKHGEKSDALGSIERHFIRKFTLPRNAHPDLVQSNLTADGHLTVTASAPKIKETSPGRTIPIKIVNTNTTGSSFGQQPSTSQQNGTSPAAQ
ncbi:unnamed protein product [Meloidogyne enterolobii]|uniref:Uncharacterized protein n=4 Tax=Meloidogyne TaxID=189290 RepID=A0ACB1AU15_MELEN|nr:unnamed protein product [Meloidogyne enterolobii]